MSLPVEQIENLLTEIARADPYESAAIASKIRRLVDDAANGAADAEPAEPAEPEAVPAK
jgi:hypothetical protein